MRLARHGLLLGWLCVGLPAVAQMDTLRLANGDILTGRFKGLDRATATVSTTYGSADIRVRWNAVRSLHTVHNMLVVLTDGTRKIARTRPAGPGELLLAGDYDTLTVKVSAVVRIVAIEKYFLNRIKASVDLGFNHTRASELSQLSLRTRLAYQDDYWRAHFNFNSVNSFQRNATDVRRTDLDLGYRYLLAKRWFLGADGVLLANTAQQLRLRSSYQLYAGRHILQDNRFTLTTTGGIAYTEEVFNSEDPKRRTPEGILGLEASVFNSGPITFNISSRAYPALAGPGRWRVDSRADARYTFPYGIYARMGVTVNYDSRPATNAVNTDYLFQSAVGWSF